MTGGRFRGCVYRRGKLGAVVIGGQQPPDRRLHSRAQAATGRQVYETSCASCHRPDLGGAAEAPALAGPNFTEHLGHARRRAACGLHPGRDAARRRAMRRSRRSRDGLHPPVERRQGRRDPARVRRGDVDCRCGAWAGTGGCNGPVPAPAAAVLRQQAQFPPGRGLTVAGEVPNYVPVTDAMLRNPPDGDWLMIRRNYQAWSHSPLTEITPANVGRLRIAWVWAMNEGGASEPTPIVHNGIIYLVNTGNIVQALDGRTGELDLGAQRRPGGDHRPGRDAQHGALPGQAVRRDDRCAARRARRAHRQAWYGTVPSPIAKRASAIPAARSSSRARWCRDSPDATVSVQIAATSAPTTPRPESWLWRFNTVAQSGRARRRYLGRTSPTGSARAARRGLPAATIPIST